MKASFEVTGANADELISAARAQAEKFANGRGWTIQGIDADEQIVRGDGAVIRWIARVELEVDDA